MSRRLCCVPRCDTAVAATPGGGYWLPCCVAHWDGLPGPIQTQAIVAAEGSPYDPRAVVAAMGVVVRIKVHFGQAPRKAKRKHA